MVDEAGANATDLGLATEDISVPEAEEEEAGLPFGLLRAEEDETEVPFLPVEEEDAVALEEDPDEEAVVTTEAG